MGISLIRCNKDRKMLKIIKKLYLSAFPKEERAPFFFLKSRAGKGGGEMLAVKEKDEFIGFVYIVRNKELVYLFYFAIAECKRGMGYGSRVLSAIREKYPDKRIFLAREQLDKASPNYAQRVSRREFYMKNGFEDIPCLLKEASVIYDTMSIGGIITPKDYEELISAWTGPIIYRLIDMRIIEK